MHNEANVALPPSPVSVPKVSTGRVRSRTLVLIRWIAVGGQAITILFVYFGLGYNLPLALTLAVVSASVLLNIFVSVRHPISRRLNETEATLYLAYDTVQLAVLLSLTGGLHNPFSFLMLGAVTISATVLSVRATALLGFLVVGCVTLLMIFHFPLPWPGGVHSLSHVYVFGIWSSVVICMAFFAVNVLRLAEEGRRMSDALTETQMALAREQHLSAVGGLAAAAAHELGTPLGTIALVTKELSHDLPGDGPHAEDLKLLISQSERCREILARLSLQPVDGTLPSFHRQPMLNLVETAATPYRREGVELRIEHDGDLAAADRRSRHGGDSESVTQPIVPHSLEFIHGLKNLIENSMGFANTWVAIRVDWSRSEATVEITDDGPGFAHDILGALGEPYVSTRRDAGGMGLGVFIAKTLLERTGAEVKFGNRRDGGARIVVTWPRAVLEAESVWSADEASPDDVAGDAPR
ncbi:MAG: ActS/PrrB/RegB family redox-sensitive histidine kinase [Rhodospirillales bacterium]|nr:ActS/PrrB/RegB family redox-sensitive histidine kinase [Rhodospirillales bacterium]